MRLSLTLVLLCWPLAFCVGCREKPSAQQSAQQTPQPPRVPASSGRPRAQHPGEFVHLWPDGGCTSIGGVTGTDENKPNYGFDGLICSDSGLLDKVRTVVTYKFALVENREAKDIYRVIRNVTRASMRNAVEEKTVTVEYAGKTVTVFDDELGKSTIGPVKIP